MDTLRHDKWSADPATARGLMPMGSQGATLTQQTSQGSAGIPHGKLARLAGLYLAKLDGTALSTIHLPIRSQAHIPFGGDPIMNYPAFSMVCINVHCRYQIVSCLLRVSRVFIVQAWRSSAMPWSSR